MSQPGKTLCAFIVVLVLVAVPVTSAVVPGSFLGLVSQYGTGKHPKTSQIGVLIEGNHSGLHFFCFSYSLFTKAKIKGSIIVEIDVIKTSGIRQLPTTRKIPIEEVDFSDHFPPSSNSCVPQSPADFHFNYGTVTECVAESMDLEDGDLVRTRFKFKKGAKLRGKTPNLSLTAYVLPNVQSDFQPLDHAKRDLQNSLLDSRAQTPAD